MTFSTAKMFFYLLQFLAYATSISSYSRPQCKTTTSSKDWPSDTEWANLNKSISGHLLKPNPPGAVCHPEQPTFNTEACLAAQRGWKVSAWHVENPISSVQDNWNNDTCLPDPADPCSGAGYPIYVVNAYTAEHVKKGIDFARKNHIRLIVKGTGHDYLGRSSAPNSLSIWTRHMRGLTFHDGFQPKKCKSSIEGHAITVAAGIEMGELNEQAHNHNLSVLSAGGETVGVGGYITGGGHAAISSTYGMAADQVLEMEIVTPGGDILTINECQNEDLFWAMRGGGGSTFGAITSMTIRAYPSAPWISTLLFLATEPGSKDYWTAAAKFSSQLPALDAQGISCYLFIQPNLTTPLLNTTAPFSVVYGIFHMPALSPQNTSASLAAALEPIIANTLAPYPAGQFFYGIPTPTVYDDFWTWYKDNNGPKSGGGDLLLGSRLLDEKALTADLPKLANALEIAGGGPKGGNTNVGISLFLVGPAGRSTRKIAPRGGDTPATNIWKNALVHAVLTASFPPLNPAAKAETSNLVTNTYTKALRDLAPNMGAYVNEADAHEPNFQTTFWGEDYKRLAKIKKEVDPEDVFWCRPCVGNEGWTEDGQGGLCRV